MPRAPRIYLEKGLYYVTVRGNYGFSLFKDDADCQEYLKLLEKYKTQHKFKIFAYYLVENSIILLIQTSEEITISEIMRDLSSNYTKYFNARYQKRGHLFQGRFRAILVEKEKYLKELSRFIHYLAVIQKLVERPQEYKWSSFPVYLGLTEQYGLPSVIDTQEVLEEFSRDKNEQVALYKAFVEAAKELEMLALMKKLAGIRILGSEEFISKVKERMKAVAREEKSPQENSLIETKNQKIRVMAMSLGVLILAGFIIYSYRADIRFRQNFEGLLAQKEVEFKKELSRQHELIRKDLEEKYQADKVSYEAMSRRLKLERQKRLDERKKKLEQL